MQEEPVKEILDHLHHKIITASNPFEKAALMRQLGYLRFQQALKTGEEDVAGFIADQYLQEYTNLVTLNSPSSVNNYTAEVTRLLKAGPAPVDPSKWKPVLQEFDYTNSLNDAFSCRGKFFDCKHSEAAELIAETFSDFDLGDWKDDGDQQDEQNMLEKPQINRNLADKQREPSNSLILINTSCQTDPWPVSGLNMNPFGSSSNRNLPQQLPKPDNHPFSNHSIRSNLPQQANPEKPSSSSFRTAKDELIAQNLKKYGTNPSTHQQFAASYGTSNKSLGGRRGVKSKFVPPSKAVADELQHSMFGHPEKQVQPADEQLKNIDPKMVELITNEIMHKFNPVDWDDIAGLEYAKSTIQEAVVWPLLRPDIFTGIRRPPRGILLFGPPGTGKTLIGKCIASQSKSTFFSISASALTSKYVGEGEKMVRALFAVAAIHQPSVIFIDEVDSLLSQRSNDEHEASRRIKTEFLVQLDGAATSQEDRLLIVGATNRPQELDEAARRRLVRRLYIPLPELEARKQILKNLLKTVNNSVSDTELYEISRLAEGYSGADMEFLCREASMEPIRCIPASQIPYFNESEVRPVNIDDFRNALSRVKASVSQDDIQQYINWNKSFGSGNNK